jgi:hypothetical protein
MPGFDGTGPRGQGPMTGRGEGYCALVLPESGQAPYGYAGLQGMPVHPGMLAARPTLGTRFACWLRPSPWLRRPFGRGPGRGPGRGRGRRLYWW